MICPHCQLNIHPSPPEGPFGRDTGGHRIWYTDDKGQHEVRDAVCPACSEVFLIHGDVITEPSAEPGVVYSHNENEWVLLPRVSSRPPAPKEVPEPYAGLYIEAAFILTDSPRASAALSRRCLQHLLREEAKAPKGNLYDEIEWAIANAGLPGYATTSLHDLREIGNLATHPNKSTATGEYMEVEPGEAEWTLDTLDTLFRFFFIDPAELARKKAALAAKTEKP